MSHLSPSCSPPSPTVPCNPATNVVLRSREGDEFVVDLLLARRMRNVCRVLPPQGAETSSLGKITFSTIGGRMLGKTIVWMQRHREDWFDMAVIQGGQLSWAQGVLHLLDDPWEQTFFSDMTPAQMLELANCARHLEVDALKEIACRFIVAALHGKSLQEIEQLLGIPVPASFAMNDQA